MQEQVKSSNTFETLEEKLKEINSKLPKNNTVPIDKEGRKSRRLLILGLALGGSFVVFIISIIITCIFVYKSVPTPPELIVLNTVMGSTITTIVGVIAGTSID